MAEDGKGSQSTPKQTQTKQGGGQRSSQERGTATNHKKNPGKRPTQGGNSR